MWRINRRRSQRLLLPGSFNDLPAILDAPSGVLVTTKEENLPVVAQAWHSRALAAERRAEKLTHALRIRLAPHLARWMAHKFVRQILSNRKHLIEIQRQAEAEIAALERRLAEVQAPLEERLRVYENRIIELEKRLLAKDQEHRELIQLTIATARKKLESEHASSDMGWN